MPVKAIDIILGAESHCNVSAHKNPTKAAQIAPIDNASTKGASLSLRIKVKFIASAKATPNPNSKPTKVVVSSTKPATSCSRSEINNPANTTKAVTSVNLDIGSFRINLDKRAAKTGAVATPMRTITTGASAIAKLKNTALSIWQHISVLKLNVTTFGKVFGPLSTAQITKYAKPLRLPRQMSIFQPSSCDRRISNVSGVNSNAPITARITPIVVVRILSVIC